MRKEAIHLTTPDAPLVKIGELMGQDLYIKVSGRHLDERDRNFVMAQQMLRQAFGMDRVTTGESMGLDPDA